MELSAAECGNLLMLRLQHLMARPNSFADDAMSPGQSDSLRFYRGGPQRFGRMILAIGLALLATWMLSSFLPAIAWAGVLAIATWPLYSIGERHLGPTWTAATLVTAITLVLLVPMLLIGMEMAREAGAVVQWAQSIAASSPTLPAWLSNLPLVGTRLASLVAKLYGRFTKHRRLVGAIGFTGDCRMGPHVGR